MKIIILLLAIAFCSTGNSQEIKKPNTDNFLKELSENGCKCVDSISVHDRPKNEIAMDIGECIDKQVDAYQMGSKLMAIDVSKEKKVGKDGKKEIDISFNTNENSAEYKKYYYELERYMMANCSSVKEKIGSTEERTAKSISSNKKAIDYYNKGLDEVTKEHPQKAIEFFEKAVKEDPEFAFAWDNLGVNFRRLDNYDKAIECYQKSLKIDPKGIMPLQNIALAYQYKGQYEKAIEAYGNLAELDKKNPEVYYGIGIVYATNLKDYEKALDNLCKAYNLYIEQKSPYRTDAEKMISLIHAEMKKQGKEEKFNQILKDNNITQN